jgi:hypothetical protein
MAGKFGGRVFAGEDSEEEEEDEIQYTFQFSSSSFGAPALVTAPVAAFTAPRFSAPAPVPSNAEDRESDDDDDTVRPPPSASTPAMAAPQPLVMTPPYAGGEESEEDDSDAEDESVQAPFESVLSQSSSGGGSKNEESPPVRTPTATAQTSTVPVVARTLPTHALLTLERDGKDDDAHWALVREADGVQVMGDAIAARLQPALDDSILRIAELTESQQHLLQLLTSQHASICANEQIQNVAVMMDKLPHYIRKVQAIKAAMAEIAASVEKMKKRGESLRVDAQSHAIKKETKRDSMAQWNKLHAAKSSDQVA